MQLALRLFGSPQVRHKKGWRLLATNQLTLLAAYLAFAETWVSRDELLLRFWPDASEAKARRNLNQLVYQLRKQTWASNLESSMTHLRLQLSTDVQIFREAITDSNWAEASHLYKAELLAGSFRGVSSNFEAWLATERHSLAKAWQDASLRYANDLALSENGKHALELLEAILKRDSLAEDVLQVYLSIALKAKQLKAAIRVFESFQAELATELNLQPSDKTLALIKQVKSALAAPLAYPKASKSIVVHNDPDNILQFNIPKYSSAFVGRDAELNALASFLRHADCRLITILAWGGMGKTRLAVKAMSEYRALFKDGVAFISLLSLSSEADIIQEITRVLGLHFDDSRRLKQQLLSYLATKTMLFVFDNFEHLLEHSGIVAELLDASANTRILATSREALNYRGEQILELRGLSQPEGIHDERFEQHDSVQLFLRTARQLGSFKFTLQDRQSLFDICRFLAGMPLAIELAAQWSRLLSLPEILKELESNLDFLESQNRDQPDRQQSIRRVFNYSWQLLKPDEQDALMKLAILKGDFSREAAQSITGISLATLFALLNKSMLEQQDGLLTRHPLVYEFSTEKLAESASFNALALRHAEYFFDLSERLKAVSNDTQSLLSLRRAHENLVLAFAYWRNQDARKALRFLLNLDRYWELRADYKELCDWLVDLLNRYLTKDALRANASLVLAKHALWQSQWLQAKHALDACLDLSQSLNLVAVEAAALHSLGQLNFFQGHYQKASSYFKQSLKLRRHLNDSAGIAESLTSLGVIAKDQGHYDVALSYYQESLSLRTQLQDKQGIATAINNLGIIAKDQGQYQKASQLYQQSLALRKGLQDQRGIAQCLLNLGLIAMHQQNYQVAKAHLEESLSLEKQIANLYGASLCLNTLANLAIDLVNYEEAETLAQESLKLKEQLGDQRGIAFSFHSLGCLEREKTNYLVAAQYFKQSLKMFKVIADQRGCLLVIADCITLFVLNKNLKSLTYFEQCRELCQSLNISLAPRSWLKTQQSIDSLEPKGIAKTLVQTPKCTLSELTNSILEELELFELA